jgi:HEAT repeat protein
MNRDEPDTGNLTHDLICQLADPAERVRQAAAEALAESTWDDDWRPDELIRQGGVPVLVELLNDKNPHTVESAIDVLIAAAASGEEEALISAGVIAGLDAIRNHKNPLIREKVQEALWLLEPVVEDVVMAKPQDEY